MFSVIIPVHNKKKHLERSIQSVLNQSYSHFELLLIDDNSTDGSSDIIEKYQKHDGVRTFHRTTSGPGGYAARNLGVNEAIYDWVCFLDADDEWDQNFLEEFYQLIDKFSDSEIFSCGWYLKNRNNLKTYKYAQNKVQEKSSKIRYQKFLRLMSKGETPICTDVIVVKKELIKAVGLFPAGKCKKGGDVDTWLRLVKEFGEIIHLNRILATYHVDSDNMISRNVENIGIGCITLTCLDLIKKSNDKSEIKLLKKVSNKYLFSHIIKLFKEGKDFSFMLSYFHKRVNYMKYLFCLFSTHPFLKKITFKIIENKSLH